MKAKADSKAKERLARIAEERRLAELEAASSASLARRGLKANHPVASQALQSNAVTAAYNLSTSTPPRSTAELQDSIDEARTASQPISRSPNSPVVSPKTEARAYNLAYYLFISCCPYKGQLDSQQESV